jgi:bifunctional N-acetylglucosamine-1-phosphate-uridyltransferase/glucosamine-1-phosphate-acetyltransferase GlmU-like protein
MTNLLDDISVIIAAAGKGSRSGLDYPKTLFEINGVPIIHRLIDASNHLDQHQNIILNPSSYEPVKSSIMKINKKCKYHIQRDQNGMGDALLSIDESKLCSNIFLMWGDLPFISKKTINETVNFYIENNLDFAFPSLIQEQAYTKVVRQNNNLIKVLESKEEGVDFYDFSERDIGVFLFNKEVIFNMLKKDLPRKIGKSSGEHGFLYLLEHLVSYGYKVDACKIALPKEAISLNTQEDCFLLESMGSD